jgi:hypothetical protein
LTQRRDRRKHRRRPVKGDAEAELAMLARRAQAFRLRIQGATFPQIAEQLGYNSRQAAWADYQAALRDAALEYDDDIADARTFELERIEAIVNRAWEHSELGDIKALDVLLRCSDRRAKLLGLDRPQQVELSMTALDAEIARLDAIIEAAREAGEDIGDPDDGD